MSKIGKARPAAGRYCAFMIMRSKTNARRRPGTLRDYQERIQRVLSHMQQHVDEPLSLDGLARVACFSTYHFHRLFTAFVGETPGLYQRRLRIERAAYHLRHTRDAVTTIALEAGYETPSAFTRAFRQLFRRSPVGYRRMRTTGPVAESEPQAGPPTRRRKMEHRIEERKEQKVVFVRRVGPYAKAAGEAWAAVCGFAFPHGLVGRDTEFIGVSYDDPDITSEDKLRYDACLTLHQDVKPEGEVGVQTLAGGRYAIFTLQGSYRGLHDLYRAIFGQWLPTSGEILRDLPCFEKYLNSPDRTPEKDLRTEIHIPIK